MNLNLKRNFRSANNFLILQFCYILVFTAIANANDESTLFVSVDDHKFSG